MTEGSDVFTYVYTSAGDDAERLQSVTPGPRRHQYQRGPVHVLRGGRPWRQWLAGDLKQVLVSSLAGTSATLRTGSGPLTEVGGSYYRYFKTGSKAGDLEDAVTGLAYERFVAARLSVDVTTAAAVGEHVLDPR